MNSYTNKLKHSLIVSCQARNGEPFNSPIFIAEFAKSAELGGADGVRINSPENIQAVREITDIPILGINKRKVDGSDVFITPTIQDVLDIIDAGADIVGLDGTIRKRPGGVSLKELVSCAHSHGKQIFADIATLEDAKYAINCGADIVATTLSGYTEDTYDVTIPNLNLLRAITNKYSIPVFLEGGVTKPDHIKKAIELGASGVVVGKSITMPHVITRMYRKALEESL